VDLLWPQPPLSCSSHQSSTLGPLIPVVAACVKDARPSRWLAPLERPRWPPPPSGWTRHQPRCFRHERVGWRGSAGDVWLLLGARDATTVSARSCSRCSSLGLFRQCLRLSSSRSAPSPPEPIGHASVLGTSLMTKTARARRARSRARHRRLKTQTSSTRADRTTVCRAASSRASTEASTGHATARGCGTRASSASGSTPMPPREITCLPARTAASTSPPTGRPPGRCARRPRRGASSRAFARASSAASRTCSQTRSTASSRAGARPAPFPRGSASRARAGSQTTTT